MRRLTAAHKSLVSLALSILRNSLLLKRSISRPNVLGQSRRLIDPTTSHQEISTTEKEFEFRGHKGWLSGGNCDGAAGVELLNHRGVKS